MPTAAELRPEQLKIYRASARKRRHKPPLTPEQRAERETLLERIREAASMLRSRFGAKRVVVFGSMAHEAWFDQVSDVDLAVEGLKGAEYWQAWGDVEELIADRQVDLIDIETASESLKRAIDHKGMDV
jgi:predicted nucleotidyltransferase